MGSSQARRERRSNLQANFTKTTLQNQIGGGGYGLPNRSNKPATGTHPTVNPFLLPKSSGLNVTTQMFPNNYFIEWDITSWRAACDQAIKMGFPVSYAALTGWTYECSPFVQSLFNALGDALTQIPVFIVDNKGNRLDDLTEQICNQRWFIELRKEILFAKFWGFTGINFDPINNKIYKYPMQQIDPINRLLRQNTFNFTDGVSFFEKDNLLFVQPSTNYESFLGWMQPISRMFIQMNMNSMNWIQAGRRLAFPLLEVQYPAADSQINNIDNLENEFRIHAENYAANIDPSKALISPYIIDDKGVIQSSLRLVPHDTTAKAGMHKIFQEFNVEEQNEIREMILGGTLTGNAGKFGTKGLGEVHQEKLETVIRARNEEVLTILNDISDFKRKLPKFFKNFPADWKFDVNRTKEFDINEIEKLSKSAQENGLQLTTKFFIKYGLDDEDIQEAPTPTKSGGFDSDETMSVQIATPNKTIMNALKKKSY
jgi:hypothetical protein